jgi:hypothetical protein
VVVRLDLVVHEILDLECVQVPSDHEPQVICHEFENMVVLQHARVFGKNRTLLGLLDIALDCH